MECDRKRQLHGELAGVRSNLSQSAEGDGSGGGKAAGSVVVAGRKELESPPSETAEYVDFGPAILNTESNMDSVMTSSACREDRTLLRQESISRNSIAWSDYPLYRKVNSI